MSGNRRVVLVSLQFPPSMQAGAHRARHLAKYLPQFGWTPIVLRADESGYAEATDPKLAALVPDTVEQVAVPALPIGLTRPLGVGDIGLRTYPYLARALDEIIHKARPEAVFFTGYPFYPMLLARRIRKTHDVPVVLDFQDPWVSDHGATRPPFSKAGLAHTLALWLEPQAVRHASHITSVSETQNRQMAARYPWLDASAMSAIPIGGDPTDFDALGVLQSARSLELLSRDRINVSYVGAFLPRSGALLHHVFAGVAEALSTAPDWRQKVRLNFIGTSNQARAGGAAQVAPIAAMHGLSDLVVEHPARIPYLEALSVLANSDAILMIGSEEPHYTASKIYPGLMSGRPYLSLFHEASSAHAILSEAGGGFSFSFSAPGDLQAQRPALAAAFTRLIQSPSTIVKADPKAFAPYEATAIAGRFAAIFDRVSRR